MRQAGSSWDEGQEPLQPLIVGWDADDRECVEREGYQHEKKKTKARRHASSESSWLDRLLERSGLRY